MSIASRHANTLDLPWADERDPLIDDGTFCITDCYGQRVAVGLRKIDAEVIVETMNARLAIYVPRVKLALRPEPGERELMR